MDKILITGGQASGKSTMAIKIADAMNEKRVFIATAIAFDEELKEKIQAHQDERGNRYDTIEEPLHLSTALNKASEMDPKVIVIDCMTIWVSNLMFQLSEESANKEIQLFLDALEKLDDANENKTIICVTNECGWGIIPADPLSRKYVKCLGNLNKQIAARFDKVYFTCCGLETRIK
ncbi:MAG: bifunctional adenosylcobinamide kinase/adenosylcobinamide-phosphate guanylyltransferase [Thermotogota bacterium]|nr:bifunctional adenosylcobinamide kinase/adenosylcobinamide-phosphate guanylyltransferase [Thermotogota bacterium]